MSKIRLAMIGVGDMGAGHCSGFDQIADCEITWVCDPNEDNVKRALTYIRKNTPKVCKDYRELLNNEDIDAVVISVPNYLHREVAIPFIESGKHVFLEKPVAHNIADCDAIIEAAERSQRIVQIGLVYRYSNLYRKMAEILKGGRLDQVSMMWCKEYREAFPPADWFYDETKSGGALVEKDCHHFDIFNWMIDSKPYRVFATGGQHVIKNGTDQMITNSYTHYPAKNISTSTIIDHAWVLVEYENGSKANLGLCMYLKPRNLTEEGLEIGLIGTNGAQMIAKNDRTLSIYGGEDSSIERIEVDSVSDSVLNGHIGSLRERTEFIKSVRTGDKPFASLEVGRSSLKIALAAERSIKEGRYVQIEEV
ncbi:gfo/Idh/MocA family oxidoreductase [Paenibacillus psychroresistens]|uniref:Gfo/Idh/MocA family oxidoreductase n=1 Tax=Paenibacillus psychroresistens TaxID=1778678 RepID=A0A6B8REI1_9BACL|nr:Gfo/Idh/MocA family oxidoreductase [Paenibacillus psychroresistens]QGQ94134.1 gfo/Idh/MocA family oxidoreductase [Paenibacillus psychroresistens]